MPRMLLSLEEASTRLGKTVRQIRYMIQQQKLTARKDGGRWVVEIDDLPASPPQQASANRKQERLRNLVDEALGLPQGERKGYSLRDLRAFQIAKPLYQAIAAHLGQEHAAALSCRRVLSHLSRGCHRFDSSSKADAYRAARDEASDAVYELLLAPQAQAETLAVGIESNLMPAIAGLLRRMDRRRAPAPQ